MQCDPNQLTGSDSSSGVAWEIDSVAFDRTSGRKIVIRYPWGIHIVLSNNSSEVETISDRNSSIALVKCLAFLKFLSDLGSFSEASLQEAAKELEEIANFYETRLSESCEPIHLPSKTIKGKVTDIYQKEPITLEP